MADIGYGYHQPPAAAVCGFGVHGIVEILGIIAIDGNQRQVAQILPAHKVSRRNIRGKKIGVAQNFRRKFLRQVVPQDRKARRQVGRPEIVEDFDDATVRRGVPLRTLAHFNDDVVALFGTVPVARGHFNRVPMAGILRLHATMILAGMPDAADAYRRIAGASNQARDTSSAFVHADGEHFDTIIVHQRRGVDSRQNQGCRAVIRHHQHLAAGAAADAPRDALTLARRCKAVWPLDRLAVANHRRQALIERLALRIASQSQLFGETRRRQRLRRFAQMLQQQFPACDRVRVAQLLQF